ncbi:hypothetical protein DPMN_115491 [Dreissena polymorpha]|uniref:Uncharacterized protein n=1 Tax=Dreissena polymorpha TaxID=45954 RepID=A0A9D4KLC8_DREPO|nr:hypothetical protein DPMN_115491 [Dreissena polymorpha]
MMIDNYDDDDEEDDDDEDDDEDDNDDDDDDYFEKMMVNNKICNYNTSKQNSTRVTFVCRYPAWYAACMFGGSGLERETVAPDGNM